MMNLCSFLALAAAPRLACGANLLANGYVVMRRSPDPARIQVYSPGLARLNSGRLLATCDVDASAVIDGDHLHALSGSGDQRAATAHDGNMITFHTVRDFRKLVY